jgi:hypothetical protein
MSEFIYVVIFAICHHDFWQHPDMTMKEFDWILSPRILVVLKPTKMNVKLGRIMTCQVIVRNGDQSRANVTLQVK